MNAQKKPELKMKIASIASKFLETPRLYFRSRRAFRRACALGLIGERFHRYGNSLGWRLLKAGKFYGRNYILTPVSITRYFEFEAALDALPKTLHARVLDVSSPRLFPFFVLERIGLEEIIMLNPDHTDIERTSDISKNLG